MTFVHRMFDYIIVGGGTSGLLLLNRLTEDPSINVLVLEAGEDRAKDPRINTPAFWTSLVGTEIDWAFQTKPQAGLHDRVAKIPQGKVLGGSSALNGQTLVAPSRAGIDAWEALGNDGWNWKKLAPYYRKFYTLHLPDAKAQEHLGLEWVDKSVAGHHGPVQASFAGSANNPLSKAWAQTFKNLNFGTNADPFTGESMGGYNNLSTIDPATKTRSYAASAYGEPSMKRPNCKVVIGAQVTKIVFDHTSSPLKAQGVQVVINGQEHNFDAQKEVVLAAGVFQSPKLLELSGIGDKRILDGFNIPVLIDNPNVGEHLQDHLLTGISYEVNDDITTMDPLMRKEPEAVKSAQELYVTKKEGPFCVGGVTSHAYMPLMEFSHDADGRAKQSKLLAEHITQNSSKEDQIVKNIISHGDDGSGALFLLQGQGLTHENEANDEHGPLYQPGNYISIGPIQTHPFSRGSTHISASDPSAKPIIDPRYFTHPLDLELMARHLLECETIRNADPMKSFLKPNGKRNHIRAHVKSLDDAKQYLIETLRTAYHCCGSCSMRPREDGGVVDTSLKVYGTSNVRVVDASVFPLVSRGNTMSTVYAVAERAADIVKGVL